VQSYQIDDGPLSPSSSLTSGHLATPASTGNEGLVPQLDAATAFGLDQLDLNASQVSSQSLETFYSSGIETATLFKKYGHPYNERKSVSDCETDLHTYTYFTCPYWTHECLSTSSMKRILSSSGRSF
jgi:hypothetical protein